MTEVSCRPFSVLMSIYIETKASDLDACMNSLWTEQTVRPMQFCLVCDGPLSEETEAVVSKWRDLLGDTLDVVRQRENKGLARALNLGLSRCRYDIVAKMDSDDLAVEDRFRRQFEYMTAHPEVDVLGGQVVEFDEENEEIIGYRDVPLSDSEIKKFSKFRCPLSHSSVMFRKPALERVGFYPEVFPEDYVLWARLEQAGATFANLPDPLVVMNVGETIRKRRGFRFFIDELKIFRRFLRMGFMSCPQYMIAVAARLPFRIIPGCLRIRLKKIQYRINN